MSESSGYRIPPTGNPAGRAKERTEVLVLDRGYAHKVVWSSWTTTMRILKRYPYVDRRKGRELHTTRLKPLVHTAGSNGSVHSAIQFHHLVPRSLGGDDVADNIVPLCQDCHGLATLRNSLVLEVLAGKLTDGEHSYVIGKMGEGALTRLFGVGV